MLSWILAAIIGAVPLYLGFHFGRARQGLTLWTGIGAMLSLLVVGLVLATGSSNPMGVLPALALAYVAGVGATGALAGGLATLALGPKDDEARK